MQEGIRIAKLIKENDRYFRPTQVRLIDEEGEQAGIVTFVDARARAKNLGLDLVIVAEQSAPPVVRIMDYNKLVYDQKKKIKDQKKKQSNHKVKEVKFRLNIEKHDYDYKINHAIEFLSKEHKVKISLMFRGREMAHKELGFDLIKKIEEDLVGCGTLDAAAKLAGRNIVVSFSPKKKK